MGATHLPRDLVRIHADEIHPFVKVHGSKLRLLDHTVIKLALEIHHEMKHMVIGFPWEKYFPGVKLIESATDRPHV